MAKRQFNSNDFKIMKNGRDNKADQKVLDWFKREKLKNLGVDQVENIQGCDGKFRKKFNGKFEEE